MNFGRVLQKATRSEILKGGKVYCFRRPLARPSKFSVPSWLPISLPYSSLRREHGASFTDADMHKTPGSLDPTSWLFLTWVRGRSRIPDIWKPSLRRGAQIDAVILGFVMLFVMVRPSLLYHAEKDGI